MLRRENQREEKTGRLLHLGKIEKKKRFSNIWSIWRTTWIIYDEMSSTEGIDANECLSFLTVPLL
jgi:cytidylate kinase